MAGRRLDALSFLDWIAVLLVIGASLVLLASPFTWIPRFGGFLRDFAAQLPSSTRLVLFPLTAPLLGLLPAVLIGLALTGLRPLGSRRLLIVGALLFAVGATGFCALALYAPLFELAGALRS